MHPSQRNVLAATCTCHAWIHVCELSVPALLLAIQAEFAVGDLAMGRVVAIYTLLFGLGSLPAGLLVDRLGSRAMLLVCMGGAGLSLLGMAASRDLATFSVAAAAMGASLSIYHPAGTSWISHRLPDSGRVYAWHGMAGNTGVAAASLVAGGIGWAVGWRAALAVLGGLSLALAAWIAASADRTRGDASRRGLAGFPWGGLAALLVGIAFMGMVYRGMTTFLPKLLAGRLGGDDGRGMFVGGAWTTAALFVGLAGMYVAGRLSDRGVHPANVFLAGALLQAPFLLAIPHVEAGATVPLVMGVAFFHFLTQPVGNQLVARLTPPELRGAGFGLYFLLSFGLGASGAWVGGWVSVRWGLPAAFTAFAILAVPAGLAMLPLRRRAAP